MSTATLARRAEIEVDHLEVGAYTIPTDGREADGTMSWSQTTIVVVHAHGGVQLKTIDAERYAA